jgi:hypothetical protein
MSPSGTRGRGASAGDARGDHRWPPPEAPPDPVPRRTGRAVVLLRGIEPADTVVVGRGEARAVSRVGPGPPTGRAPWPVSGRPGAAFTGSLCGDGAVELPRTGRSAHRFGACAVCPKRRTSSSRAGPFRDSSSALISDSVTVLDLTCRFPILARVSSSTAGQPPARDRPRSLTPRDRPNIEPRNRRDGSPHIVRAGCSLCIAAAGSFAGRPPPATATAMADRA